MTMKTKLTMNHPRVRQVLDCGCRTVEGGLRRVDIPLPISRQAVPRLNLLSDRESIFSASDEKRQRAGALQKLRLVPCSGTRASVLDCGSPLPLSERWRSRQKPYRAFSLIEMIGVLAVIAILAATLAPSFVRQMDKTAGDQESAALKSFDDALQSSIMRSRYIPSATDWASRVATELGVDTTAVTDSPRRQPRFFLIDPNLNINNTGLTPGGNGEPALPYTQANGGSPNFPVSPRLLIL